MEIDITDFFQNAGMIDYSASRAEIGADAARITWNAAIEDSEEFPLLTNEDQREAFRDFVKGFGAWDEDEIRSWTDTELNALCMQFVAGDVRESHIDTQDPDWARVEREHDGGFRFFASGDRVYYELSC